MISVSIALNSDWRQKNQRTDPRDQPNGRREATANYIAELCAQYGVEASRIAHGVPVGGELEMVDGTTLSHSLAGRHKIVL